MEQNAQQSPIASAFKHGGIQGLMAAVPVAIWLHSKQKEAIVQVLGTLEEERLLALRSPHAARQLVGEATKLAMKDPVVLGAVLVGSSATHGAWRGYHRSKAGHQQHESFTAREEERRVLAPAGAPTRA